MKKSSDVLGLTMIGIKEGRENGIAQDFMIDTNTKLVKYLILKSSSGYGFKVMNVSDVQAIGADYIIAPTIDDAINIYESKEIMEEIEKGFFILGTTVLSSTGDIIGTVSDFTFDEKTGKMDIIQLDDGNEFSADKITTLAGKMVFIDPDGTAMSAIAAQEATASAKVAEEIVEEPIVEAEEIIPPIIEEPEEIIVPTPDEIIIPEPEEIILPEPEQIIVPEPVVVSEPKSALEQESMAFLLGKVVKSDVVSDDGVFHVTAGTKLTQDLINEADKHDAILTLTLSV